MRKNILALVVLCSMLLFACTAWSLTINYGGNASYNVGDVDVIVARTILPNSGTAENDWLLANNFTVVNEYDTIASNWYLTNSSGIYALKLIDAPDFYFIKIGIGALTISSDHFIYKNSSDLEWAVIDLTGWQGTPTQKVNIGRVSHLGEGTTTQVPEPSMMFLLGVGLVGLVGGRKYNV